MSDPEEGKAVPSEISVKIYRYIPDCKISLASFVSYFHLLLFRSFIRIRSFYFVSWSLLQKLIQDGLCINYQLALRICYWFSRIITNPYDLQLLVLVLFHSVF